MLKVGEHVVDVAGDRDAGGQAKLSHERPVRLEERSRTDEACADGRSGSREPGQCADEDVDALARVVPRDADDERCALRSQTADRRRYRGRVPGVGPERERRRIGQPPDVEPGPAGRLDESADGVVVDQEPRRAAVSTPLGRRRHRPHPAV